VGGSVNTVGTGTLTLTRKTSRTVTGGCHWGRVEEEISVSRACAASLGPCRPVCGRSGVGVTMLVGVWSRLRLLKLCDRATVRLVYTS
jgi:hypothetical protein